MSDRVVEGAGGIVAEGSFVVIQRELVKGAISGWDEEGEGDFGVWVEEWVRLAWEYLCIMN